MNVVPLRTIEVDAAPAYSQADFDYESMISNPEDRDWAESAAGFITFGLGQAVVKVLEAGSLLADAKQRLPHGEYLPWVEQACHLKPRQAQKLIRAAEWANAAHVAHLDGVTDTGTLFILSADTTTEEVREWFLERCAAGDPPSRKEVQERKRTSGTPRQPQPAESLAISLIRKGEIDRHRQAIALAEKATVIPSEQVLQELGLRQLPKGSVIYGLQADFHKCKDGSWIRLPHAPQLEVSVIEQRPSDLSEAALVLSFDQAAQRLGLSRGYLQRRCSPGAVQASGELVASGYRVTKAGRGLLALTPV